MEEHKVTYAGTGIGDLKGETGRVGIAGDPGTRGGPGILATMSGDPTGVQPPTDIEGLIEKYGDFRGSVGTSHGDRGIRRDKSLYGLTAEIGAGGWNFTLSKYLDRLLVAMGLNYNQIISYDIDYDTKVSIKAICGHRGTLEDLADVLMNLGIKCEVGEIELR